MLGFSSIGSRAIGESSDSTDSGGTDPVVTIVTAAGRSSGSSTVFAVSNVIATVVGSVTGKSVVSGYTSTYTRGVTANDKLTINLLPPIYATERVLNEPLYAIALI